MIKETVKERVIKYLDYQNISNRQFEIAIGVSNGYVNNMRRSVQPDKIAKIALNFPDLNTGWLLTGNGEMLNEDPESKLANEPHFCFECAEKNAEILRLHKKIIELQDRLLNAETKK